MGSLTVTNVRIRTLNPEGRIKAVASITLNDCFVVHDVRVVEGHNGLFVAMPSRKIPEGGFRNIAHPINTETRETIQEAVLAAYREADECNRWTLEGPGREEGSEDGEEGGS